MDQHFSPARQSNLIEDKAGSHQSPEPALFTAGPVTGFVAVDNGLMRQLPFQFGAGFGHRFTGLFPTVLDTAQTERNPQNLLHQFQHHTARHPANYRQIRNQRGQIRSKVAPDLWRQVRLSRLIALRTDHSMALILRNMRFDARQFRHLMASWFTLYRSIPAVSG